MIKEATRARAEAESQAEPECADGDEASPFPGITLPENVILAGKWLLVIALLVIIYLALDHLLLPKLRTYF